jgi:protein-tyrosine phosphatase
MQRNILLLCTGNICRSPMAEGLMREHLPRHEIFSAGLCALDGAPADPIAVELMWQAGIDISGHRARNLASWMMREADLVLTMDSAQQQYIAQRFPAARDKFTRLGEPCDMDIPDPYRQGLPAFQHAYRLIECVVQRRLPVLARHGVACALN